MDRSSPSEEKIALFRELRTLRGAPLRLRVGINTGEVLVRIGVAPGSGERFLAGDTIDTA